MDWIIN